MENNIRKMNRGQFLGMVGTGALGLLAGCRSAGRGKTTSSGFLFLEAEGFEDFGGWELDQQSMDQMGSPYLLAHGLGVPVNDAETNVRFPSAGRYRVWVRTRDWVAPWNAPGAPGKFQLMIDGEPLAETFGTQNAEWHWHDGGVVEVPLEAKITLRDLTGFEGRCEAVLFCKDIDFEPVHDVEALAAFRRKLLGLQEKPEDGGRFDLVVTGGGLAGTCAAISAARQGLKVALVQDRPVLGGNGSSEVRVWPEGHTNKEPYPRIGDIVNEILPPIQKQKGQVLNGVDSSYYDDARKREVVENEPNITLFMDHRAVDVETNGGAIQSIIIQSTHTARQKRLQGTWFADCTGDAVVGHQAGADYEYKVEQLMGSSNLFSVLDASKKEDVLGCECKDKAALTTNYERGEYEQPFPRCPWALDLSNKPFPGRKGMKTFNREGLQAFANMWYWESGFEQDQVEDIERIRDHNFRAMYGAWDAIKNVDGMYPNHRLGWSAFIAGKRESRRLMGDVVLDAEDFKQQREFEDAAFPCSWHVDLHFPNTAYQEGFEGSEFVSDYTRGSAYQYGGLYWAPYRTLYSRNISNLFMAGRDISVTKSGLGPVRVMKTCGMMGEVVGLAAGICKQHDCSPRTVYTDHLEELKERMRQGSGAADNARMESDRGPAMQRPRTAMMAFALGMSFVLLGVPDALAQATERIVNPEFSADMEWGTVPYAVNSRWNEYNLHKNAGRVSDAGALDGYALQIEAGAAWTAHQLLGYGGYGGRGQSIMPCPEPGTQYTLSCRAKTDVKAGEDPGECVLEFFLSNGDRVLSPKVLFPDSSGSYVTKSETFTIPANTVWCIAWVRKTKAGDMFVDSVSLKATVDDTPAVPTGFTAVESSGRQIRLQWNEVPGCIGYEIQRRDSSDPDTDYTTANIVLSSSTTSYSDGFDLDTSKLNPGNSYRYRLRAVGNYGPSGWTSITASTPALTSSPGNTTYYIDATGGDDSNPGTSPANAWQTFYPVGRLDLAPGDSVLLKCGEAWDEPLNLMGSGSSASPIIVSSYGTGAKPYINVECRNNAAIRTINESYYEFSDLEVANHQDPAEHPHALLHGKRLGRTFAIEAGRQWGTITHIYFDHITISGTASIYATLGNAGEDSQHRSAGLRITHSARGGKATGSPVISNVRVTNCDIDHVQHKGMEIGWINGCTIQSNRVTRSGHAAIHGREIYNGYFADNYFGDTGLYLTESDNAALDWYKGANCTVEYNIFNRTYGASKCQAMTWDGVDDFIIQYNYCQDIAAGFIVFNSDANRNIVRYNIIQGMGDPMFRLMGLQDSEIYNNVGYRHSGEEGSFVTIGNEVGGDRPSLNNRIENNIIYTMDASDSFELIKLWGNHAGNIIDNNVYYGNFTDAPPAEDANAKTDDPLFVNPGGGSVDETNHTFNADGYKLRADSPYIGGGNIVPNNGGRDFWGTPLPGTAPAIGAHEYAGGSTSVELPIFDDFETGPNPANYAAVPYPAGVWHMQDALGNGWSLEAQDTSVVIDDINGDSNNVMQLGWGYDEVAVLLSTTTLIDLTKDYTFSGSWKIDTLFSPLGFVAGIAEFNAADGSMVQRLTPDSSVFGDTVSPTVGETGSFEVTVTSAQLQSAGVTAGNTIGMFLHHDDDGTLYHEVADFPIKGDVYLIDDIHLYESDPFGQWMLIYGVSGATNDADGDGVGNWTEYIFGGNPTNNDASSILPMLGIVPESGTNWLEYVYRRRSDYAARGLSYTVEANTNLVSGTWSTNGVLYAGYGSVNDEIDSVTNRISTETFPKQFIRLRVE